MRPKSPIVHRIYFSDLSGLSVAAAGAEEFVIEGPEAHHAVTVKRLRVGEPIQLFDGCGMVAEGSALHVETGKRASVVVRIEAVTESVRPPARLEVWCPPPKGDRLEWLIDQLSQVGVACWRPMKTDRVERNAFRTDKLERVCVESAKQCGRDWLLEIGPWAGFDELLSDPRAWLADASGSAGTISGRDGVIGFGPEGGWSPHEIEAFRATDRPVLRFGAHVMRIETAAVVGAGRLLSDMQTTGGDRA
ncbi:MAG: RsmE family RNA methyltransferase [Planctomycetota bacterium]